MTYTDHGTSLEEIHKIMDACEFEKMDESESITSLKETFAKLDLNKYYLLVAYERNGSPVCWFVLKGAKFVRGYCEAIEQYPPSLMEGLPEIESVDRVILYRLIPPTEYYSEYMRLGHEEIDKQHSNIVEKWNELVYGVMEGRENLLKTLEELAGTVYRHLDYEEELMKRYKYPFMKRHVIDHRSLRNSLEKITRLAKNSGVLMAIKEELGFIEAYIKDHLYREDAPLVAYLKSREQSSRR